MSQVSLGIFTGIESGQIYPMLLIIPVEWNCGKYVGWKVYCIISLCVQKIPKHCIYDVGSIYFSLSNKIMVFREKCGILILSQNLRKSRSVAVDIHIVKHLYYKCSHTVCLVQRSSVGQRNFNSTFILQQHGLVFFSCTLRTFIPSCHTSTTDFVLILTTKILV